MASHSDLVDRPNPHLDSGRFGRPLSVPALPPSCSFGVDQSDFDPSDRDSAFSFPDDSFHPPDGDDSAMSAARIAAEARTVLLKYQGDLFGTSSAGASVFAQGGRPSAHRDDRGLFMDARPRSVPGIALPEEFVSAIQSLDVENIDKAIPRSVKRAFAFTDEDDIQFFSEKVLSPDTLAFATSLRDPSLSSPLKSRDYVQADRAWASVAEASSVGARCAAYATALADLLVQADELEVEEDDRRTIGELLVHISARTFSEAMRTQLRVTHHRRLAAFKALNLPKDFNSSAVTRVPREGPFIFGGQFLSAVDSDISMNTRAREVARRVKPRLESFRRFPSRGGTATSFPSAGSFRPRSRGRGFSRRSTTRGRGRAQSAPSGLAAPGAQGGTNRK